MAGQVGVRELRDRLSSYLARVQAGEQIEVTDRGQPIALLVPLPHSRAVIAQLVTSGQIRLAERSWLPGMARATAPEGARLPSEHVDENRADRQ